MSDRAPVPPPPLLETLMRDTLDPGYQRAAQRRSAGEPTPSPRASRNWLAAGTLVVGLLLAVAFTTTRAGHADANQVRAALLADVSRAQAQEAALVASVTALDDEVRLAQSAAGGSGPLAQLAVLEDLAALTAVTGPGLRITLNDPNAATGNGAVLDRDLQLLVNGLWSAGAEAVAISDVRLRVTSAIRQAGGAILVDNRPVAWPIVIQAIGDPRSVHQRFISTPGFGRFSSFVQLYDIGFEVLVVDSVTLPAAAAVDARYLETTSSTSGPATTPEAGTATATGTGAGIGTAAVTETTAATTG